MLGISVQDGGPEAAAPLPLDVREFSKIIPIQAKVCLYSLWNLKLTFCGSSWKSRNIPTVWCCEISGNSQWLLINWCKWWFHKHTRDVCWHLGIVFLTDYLHLFVSREFMIHDAPEHDSPGWELWQLVRSTSHFISDYDLVLLRCAIDESRISKWCQQSKWRLCSATWMLSLT